MTEFESAITLRQSVVLPLHHTPVVDPLRIERSFRHLIRVPPITLPAEVHVSLAFD